MNTKIIINLQFAATHHWSTIPQEHSQFYLKELHRHVFHIRMKWYVDDDDRQIEFIELKNGIENWLKSSYKVPGEFTPCIGRMSCEMFCKLLMDKFDACYVRVLEDGENGAEIG